LALLWQPALVDSAQGDVAALEPVAISEQISSRPAYRPEAARWEQYANANDVGDAIAPSPSNDVDADALDVAFEGL
jgi:hypothetical protein